MATLNKIMIIGNLGGDPEMRYTAQGTPMTTFSMAVNRFYNDPNGERQKETQWFRVVTWRQRAELCNQYLAKGHRAYVEGQFRGRSWEGADGQTRYTNEILADRVVFLERPGDTGFGRGEAPFDDEIVDPDKLPF
jgi:single-strand DNA-binding protein